MQNKTYTISCLYAYIIRRSISVSSISLMVNDMNKTHTAIVIHTG